ncbi:hypothetical protein E1200_06165 [Actinomadura sp. GC306]|uniref:hypothetical protein n=1 Tax=Actinomadura sp. GC306 TaxID=2530367 RepID=UPI00104E16CE|nr:hypothetical protein [Actinomadura sp. GC306]TDC70172.1 hypothetical protein E1200_06165 [Actinomadura sp. GC306]
MTITTDQATTVAKDPRELVTPEQFRVMVDDVVTFDKVTRPYAEAGVAQFLVFMKAWGDTMAEAGGDPRVWVKFAPSPAVDKIWHRSMMRTRTFAEVCDQVAGRFMHHLPIMDEDIRSGQASERGLAAMHATGYRVDLEWWLDGESCCPENCAQPPMTA